MANFYGTARTNYFKVKDLEAFKKFVEELSGAVLITKEGLFGFYSDDSSGCMPSSVYNRETGEHEDIDVIEEVSKHLAEGEVAVFMEAGAEKMRYISGWSTVVNHKGETVDINLDCIYSMAFEKFGVQPSKAEY